METIKELNLPYVLFDKYRDTTGSYIGKVMLGSTPKMLIIIFSVVIAAYISEISFGNVYTKTNLGVYMICYANPNAVDSSYRICNSLVGAAISSIMVCMMLMIFDVFIPCVDKMFRRLAHGLSLSLSIIMGIMLLVTSSLMVDIYVKYCNHVEDNPVYVPFYISKCGVYQRPFLVLPVFGYFTMVTWGINGWISIMRLAMTR